MREEIIFGTGGWRAIIADGFTKENVMILAQALVSEIGKVEKQEIVIGYDRRFLSDTAAVWLSEVFSANKIKVHLINKPSPSPMIMFAVDNLDLDYGICVTASHNPALYNGIKIFTKGGRDATEKVTDQLMKNIKDNKQVKHIPIEQAYKEQLVENFNPQNDYIDSILKYVDKDAIRNANLKVLVDTMYGVSKTSLSIILFTTRCDVDIINERHDTLFGGKLPSPESKTLHKLSDMVNEGEYDLGIATDGDADRIGIIDENGRFIHPNLLLALLYEYQLTYKGLSGPAVRNLSTTHLLDKIAKKHGQYVVEVPVGFKHISEAMEKHDAIIGGESSGGLTVKGHIRGKDGIFAATILVEMIATTNKSIGQLVNELYKEYGDLYNDEISLSFSLEDKERITKILFEDKLIPDFDCEIAKVEYFDGLKVYFKNDSWLSARFSGTEPLIRIFVESSSNEKNKKMISDLRSLLAI